MKFHVKAQIECHAFGCPARANGEVTLCRGFFGDVHVEGFQLEVGWTFDNDGVDALCPEHSKK